MATRNFEKYFRHTRYTYNDIMAQISKTKSQYENVEYESRKEQFSVFIKLQPTPASVVYTVKLICAVNSSKVDIFVVNPKIEQRKQGECIPHMYFDGSLCLYYPKQKEWCINDDWATTLIPWTALWLFYYEIWVETGEWLGGGKHPR